MSKLSCRFRPSIARCKVALSKPAVWGLSAFAIAALSYQNCSGGFKIQDSIVQAEQASLAVPEVDVSGVPPLTKETAITLNFEVRGIERNYILKTECQLDALPPTDCSARTMTYSALADGDHTFKVTVESVRGKKTTNSAVFRKDSTSPVLMITSAPVALGNQVNPSFVFTTTDNLSGIDSVECKVDAEAFKLCTSPLNLTALTAGQHNIQIRVKDKAGNLATPYSYDWTIDLTVPTVTIATGPNPATNSANATFTFSGDLIVTFECELDSGGFTACTSPKTYSLAAEGNHIFKVRGKSAAGNQSLPASYTWLYDATPPTVPTITTTTPVLTTSQSASFSFTSTDAASGVAGYLCSLDGSTPADCTSPKAYTLLLTGEHTFKVRAKDNAGNTSQDAMYRWTIDNTGPVITITQSPIALSRTSASNFAFTATDANGVSEQLCSIKSEVTNIPPSPCLTVVNYDLDPGRYKWTVRVTDALGNASEASYFWEIETPTAAPIAWKSLNSGSFGGCGITTQGAVTCFGSGFKKTTSIPSFAGAKQVSTSFPVCALMQNGTVRCIEGFNSSISNEVSGITDAKQISGTETHQCILTADNRVGCWGSNNVYGQLGNGEVSSASYASPVYAVGINDASYVSAGWYRTCAVVSQGKVKCWGFGLYGELGNGANLDSNVPVEVTGITGAKTVSVGVFTTCALLTSGEVRCWGMHPGDGTDNASNVPVKVKGITDASAVEAGYHFNCLTTRDQTLKCWGNLSGAGEPDIATEPTDYDNMKDVSYVGSGRQSCVVQSNGNGRCRGTNEWGNLGVNSTTLTYQPRISRQLTGLKSLDVRQQSACLLTNDEKVKCWGLFSDYGFPGSHHPTEIKDLSGVKQLVWNNTNGCALIANGTVKCWGSGFSGELGNGAFNNSATPVEVTGLTNVKQISTTCALTTDGNVYCWGSYNSSSGQYVKRATPERIIGVSGIKSVAQNVDGLGRFCGINSNDRVQCWTNAPDAVPVTIQGLQDVMQLEVSYTQSCAVSRDFSLRCWGNAALWEDMGLGPVDPRITSMVPYTLQGLETGVRLVRGHVAGKCAIKTNNEIYCWGADETGKFGTGESRNLDYPTKITPLKPVVDINVSQYSTAFVHTDGSVSVSGVIRYFYGRYSAAVQ